MKKSNVFILLCCLLLSCFSMEIYAQGNSGNSNTQQYSDDEFEFEFEVELIEAEQEDSDDDGGDDDNGDDDDSDDDSDNNNDDDDDDDDGDNDDDDGDNDDDDDDDNESEAAGELIGVQITVENNGKSIIDANIFFRAYISDEVPETVPNSYDAEEILYLLGTPLQPNESREIFIDLSEKRGGGKVVTVWPLIDADKSDKKDDTPFVSITIPKADVSSLNLNDFGSIKTYPNPTTGILNIDIPEHTSSTQITIYNKSGQAIKVFDEVASGLTALDLDGLLQGIYFAAIRNEHGQTIHYTKIAIR